MWFQPRNWLSIHVAYHVKKIDTTLHTLRLLYMDSSEV